MLGCTNPVNIKNPFTGVLMTVPCGHCDSCLCCNSSQWKQRLMMESQCHNYTLFVTLTYTDEYLPLIDLTKLDSSILNDDFKEAILQSSEFIKLHNNLIPCISIKDLQDFFKRLRINLIRKLKLNEKQRILRYFVACEYGPTTFRPHYHMLLWFDSSKIAKVIKEYIYKAWQPKTSLKSLSSFLARNRVAFVNSASSAIGYVSQYINCLADIPQILRQPLFRTKHIESRNPPIGELYLSKQFVREFSLGNFDRFTFKEPKTGKLKSVSVWRSFKDRFFARCPKFSSLPHAGRIALYSLLSLSEQNLKEPSFEAFKEWLLSKWYDLLPSVSYIRYAFRLKDVESFDVNEKEWFSIRLWFLRVRRLYEFRISVGLSLEAFVSLIEDFWSRQEYIQLVEQLKFQEDLSNRPFIGVDGKFVSQLSFYPYIIDNLFYNNERNLPSNYYVDLEKQFSVMLPYSLPKNSIDYHHRVSLTHKIVSDNTKSRRKKDYISNHPEFQAVYGQLMFNKLLFNSL